MDDIIPQDPAHKLRSSEDIEGEEENLQLTNNLHDQKFNNTRNKRQQHNNNQLKC
jgi:hypothetical protein